MNERKQELSQLIANVTEYVCNRERIPIERRIAAFQSRERIAQMDVYERDACLEIRNEVTRVVGEHIKKEFEYTDKAARLWKKETFGNMPEMELGEFIERVYAEYSAECRRFNELHRQIGRRK